MKVQALCIASVWDSEACWMFYKGQTYEIDSESKIANLTTVPWDEHPVDELGNPCVPLPKPPYAFQFDRTVNTGGRGRQ
jgi:hypothetical protein